MRLEDLTPGVVVGGVVPGVDVSVVAVDWSGPDAVVLTYRDGDRNLGEKVLYRTDEARLHKSEQASRPFDAPPEEFQRAAEAQRIKMAGLFDPMLAVSTSAVDPLPHQIRAVYGEMLPRTPLRFLLADDPGAGKTIMAGLYIKELILRGDLERCLIVAPGGLVDQWQEELLDKFNLEFEILTAQMIQTTIAASVFERHPRMIARMDQLARNDELLAALEVSDWDLVVVDEAHRMSASYFGNEAKFTKRYMLGKLLGDVTRHLLLMTATPHAGKHEDFHLFLALLDPDRFEGRYRPGHHDDDTSGLMRRMVKEELLTFEGTKLFPERIAETVSYELSPLEAELYREVTEYVRTEMNRADKIEKQRGNTVGFALTILQRRLASSPEAIYRSIIRRRKRLEKRRHEIETGQAPRLDDELAADTERLDDIDELSAEEVEQLEETVLDAATAARTVAELDAELVTLTRLEELAADVRRSGQDRKWQELRTILDERILMSRRDGSPRKLIVFTEHKDTLAYLEERIGRLFGHPNAVVAIHGGVPRSERRRITTEFTWNDECQVLVATDAAGEGLNLQRAHLMVNYDLPWNPNRIEQRFGRIHRIGQEHVCRLWNLVATDTREGQVYKRLLDKVEAQQEAYRGKVFDVLGEAFEGRPLREMMIKAIRYGDDPARRAELEQVIDADIGAGLRELLDQHALSGDVMSEDNLGMWRREMDEAKARRVQPYYIGRFFHEAFRHLGGRIARREKDRFEITHVPAALRQTDPRFPGRQPIATRYERVAFDLDRLTGPGLARAELLAPGHPLFDAVVDAIITRYGDALAKGSVLVDPQAGPKAGERLVVAVLEEIVDGTGAGVARRFGYVSVDRDGDAASAGTAPFIDFEPPQTQHSARAAASSATWSGDAERAAGQWIIQHELPDYGDRVARKRIAEIDKARSAIKTRLDAEINHLYGQASQAEAKEAEGKEVRVRASTLIQRAQKLDERQNARMRELDQQVNLTLRPPRIMGAALVLPGGTPQDVPDHAINTKEVERRAVDAVLAAERKLGREPKEMPFTNPGYDIESLNEDGHLIFIEVKGRIAGAEDFYITANEVMHGKNAAPNYRLALVRVSPDGPDQDDIRYVADPFTGIELDSLTARIVRMWDAEWSRGSAPF